MKKKFTASLLAALIAALLLAGAAMAVGLNLFDIFGRGDERPLPPGRGGGASHRRGAQRESQALGTTRPPLKTPITTGVR